MTFKEAADFVMPIGKHKGRTLDKIAETDTGLKYLDWLRGIRAQEGKDWPEDKAMHVYLSDPTIQKELERISQ